MNSWAPVAIICVTYNSAGVVGAMLESLPSGLAGVPEWRLIVVDNDSQDETVTVVQERCREATVVISDENAGFAAGVNRGLRRLHPRESALLVNPDARLGPGSVARMLDALAEEDVGIVAPQLVEPDGSCYPSLRRDTSVLRVLLAAILGDRRSGRIPNGGEIITGRRAYREPRDVAWAGGAVLLLRPGLIGVIGELDESFFLYSEETELSLRARRAGYRVRYEPEAVAVHLGGESTSSPRLYRLMVGNRLRLYARLHPRWKARCYRQALVLHQRIRTLRGDRLAQEGLAALENPRLLDG